MKNTLFFASILAIQSSAFIHEIGHYEPFFRQWLNNHNQTSNSVDHYTHMLYNYAMNDDFITQNHESNLPYTLGHNRFSHLNSNEFSQYLNTGVRIPGPNTYQEDYHLDEVYLPVSVDWTTQGAVTGVKDQGNCGSCWSFAATATIEGRYAIKHGSKVILSEQQMVDCATACSACYGGWASSALQYVQKAGGQMSAASYPYIAD